MPKLYYAASVQFTDATGYTLFGVGKTWQDWEARCRELAQRDRKQIAKIEVCFRDEHKVIVDVSDDLRRQ